MDIDLQVRLAAFNWLSEQVNLHGEDVLPRKLLEQGFEFQGQRIPLISPQGIFKPKILDLPISIYTSPNGLYNDSLGPGDLLTYKYRGENPNHKDNIGLRKVFELKLPLVYFHGLMPSRYFVMWPVYIVADDPSSLSFTAALDDIASVGIETNVSMQIAEGVDARRAYITSNVKVRLHQRGFRERVLDAYRSQCAFCRLKHRELLDAAHIIPDNLSESRPTIDNGISLCKLHHAAYDSLFLGITPDYIIQVREDILEEEDGPVLQHGLKGLHKTKLILPTSRDKWPSQEALEWRYSRFMSAR
jgi:putative restriction endonuclease